MHFATTVNSANVVNAVKQANEPGKKTIGLTGERGGELAAHQSGVHQSAFGGYGKDTGGPHPDRAYSLRNG